MPTQVAAIIGGGMHVVIILLVPAMRRVSEAGVSARMKPDAAPSAARNGDAAAMQYLSQSGIIASHRCLAA